MYGQGIKLLFLKMLKIYIYSQLKVIAVKLKKKLKDLQQQVEAEKMNLKTTEADYQNKITVFQNQIKGFRKIQADYDKLQDVLDEEKKEKATLKKKIESADREIILFKQQLEESKSEMDKMKADKIRYVNDFLLSFTLHFFKCTIFNVNQHHF